MTRTTLDQLSVLVARGRLRSALETLNLLSECRFTALFRFGDSDLRNLVIIDRQNPYAAAMDVVPIDQSYCMFVRESHAAFLVTDSTDDLRLDGHPKRPLVRTYVGFPVLSGDTVFGTVCHFDDTVIEVPSEVIALTRDFAASLEPLGAVAGLQRALEHRVESLGLLSDEILLASTTHDEALEAFEEYAQPLRLEADRLLDPQAAARFRLSIDVLASRFDSMTVAPATAPRAATSGMERQPAH